MDQGSLVETLRVLGKTLISRDLVEIQDLSLGKAGEFLYLLRLNGIILKQRGSLAIAADRIECDLYDWLKNGQNSKYHYMGDYMNQYSWPEYVHAELDEISYAMEE